MRATNPTSANFNVQLFAYGADGTLLGNAAVIGGFNFWDDVSFVLPTVYTWKGGNDSGA